MGKKIIFFSTPALGHITPAYGVIKILVRDGYKVDWYCSKKYEKIIEESGANFIEYGIDFENECNLSNVTENLVKLLDSLVNLNQSGYTLYNNIDYNNVALIIYDSMISFAKNISKEKNIKSICLCTTMAYNPFVFIFSNLFCSTIKLFANNISRVTKIIKKEKEFRKQNDLQKFSLIDFFINSRG